VTFSSSQVSQYLRCPRSYRFRYLDGWREKDSRAALCFGRCFEKAIAALFEGEDAGAVGNFAMPGPVENLSLIPAGVMKPGFHPSVERYRERFAELREAFDHIFVSTSAIGRETEATLLGQIADGVVLIVEANHSRRETVRRAKEQLESAHVRLLGAVLDQRTFPIPEKLYRRL